MNSPIISIDISHNPDLVRLVEEVQASKRPRILKQDSEPVAMLMPMETPTQRHAAIEASEMLPLAQIEASFVEAGYPKTEVNDMLEALSELPQYASTGHTFSKSK